MRTQKNQHGLSIWAFLFTAAVVGFFAFLFMKVFPAYYENLRIKRAMEIMVQDDNVGKSNKREVIKKLNRRLIIDYVNEVVDMNQAMTLTRKNSGVEIIVAYEVVIPIAYNLNALVEFENVVFARP